MWVNVVGSSDATLAEDHSPGHWGLAQWQVSVWPVLEEGSLPGRGLVAFLTLLHLPVAGSEGCQGAQVAVGPAPGGPASGEHRDTEPPSS